LCFDAINSARRHRAAGGAQTIIQNICGAVQMMTIDGGGGDCRCSYGDVTDGVKNALRE